MPSSDNLYLPSINSFFSIALIFLGILTFLKIAIEIIQVYLLGRSKWSYGPRSTFGMASENIIGKLVLLMSAILLCTLIFIIFKAAIPKGVWFNNDYIIIAVGLFLWFIGPAQILMYRKKMHLDPLLIGGVFMLWIIVSFFGTYLLSWIKGGRPTDYVQQSIGFTSLGIFAVVLMLDKLLPHLRKTPIGLMEVTPRTFTDDTDDYEDNEDKSTPNVYENFFNSTLSGDANETNLDDDRYNGGSVIRARRYKRSRR